MERKTVIKSSLLIVAGLATIALVVGYSYTKAVPPKQFNFKNPHDVAMASAIHAISSETLENRYVDAQYLLARISDEQLINTKTTDMRQEELVRCYTRLFIDRCNKAFVKSSEWDRPDLSHTFMRERIGELKNEKNSKGKTVIERNSIYILQMDSIIITLDRYDAAWDLSKKTTYVNIDTTKSRVQAAANYKGDDKLKNCTALIQALNELPEKIKQSHLSKIKNLAQNFNQKNPSFDNISVFCSIDDILRIVDEYEQYYKSDSETINKIIKGIGKHKEEIIKSWITFVTDVNNYKEFTDVLQDGKIKERGYNDDLNRFSKFLNKFGEDSEPWLSERKVKELEDLLFDKLNKDIKDEDSFYQYKHSDYKYR